jgi:hypothetical protein
MDTYKCVNFFKSRNAMGSISLILLFPKSLKQTNTLELKYDLENKIYFEFATATIYNAKR